MIDKLKAMDCPMCGGTVVIDKDSVTCNYCRSEFFPLVDKISGLVVSLYVPVPDTMCSTSSALWVDSKFRDNW